VFVGVEAIRTGFIFLLVFDNVNVNVNQKFLAWL